MRGAPQEVMCLTDPLTRLLSRPAANVLWMAILLMLALTAASCDEGNNIAYVNMTDRTLEVFINDLLEVTLEPYETRELGMIKFSLPRLFEAKDEDGTVVFSETLTWEDLEAREFRIVFRDSMQDESRSFGGKDSAAARERTPPSPPSSKTRAPARS